MVKTHQRLFAAGGTDVENDQVQLPTRLELDDQAPQRLHLILVQTFVLAFKPICYAISSHTASLQTQIFDIRIISGDISTNEHA
jgi:hypothetical protein